MKNIFRFRRKKKAQTEVQQPLLTVEQAKEQARALAAAKESRDRVLEATQKGNLDALQLQRHKNDREIISAAVQHAGMTLEYASEELQNDIAIVRAAVRQNWRALKFASPELKKDKTLFHLWEQRFKKTSVKSQSLNFLWMNLDLPAKPDPKDGSIVMPLPEEYIGNVREAGKRHPHADINLWVDSQRLTQKQWDYLTAVTEDGLPNVHVKDLRSIPDYANEELFSRSEKTKDWRLSYQGSNVWLQVDAAKILISLQGDYNQYFFADLDHAHIDIEDTDLQKKLDKYGLAIGGASHIDWGSENQLWGFDRTRLNFFKDYYAAGLSDSYKDTIAYSTLQKKLRTLSQLEHLSGANVGIDVGSKGLAHAVQPGHEWSGDDTFGKYEGRSSVPADELKQIFNARNAKNDPVAKPAAPQKAVVMPTAPAVAM